MKFEELDYDVQYLFNVEDFLQAHGAPRILIGFMHGLIKEEIGEEKTDYFLLKDDTWRKF